jgi:hypothetical protein
MDIATREQFIQTKRSARRREQELRWAAKRQRTQELRWAELDKVRAIYRQEA